MKLRLTTYYPTKYSRGDAVIVGHRRRGMTTIALSRETVKRLRALARDLEKIAKKDDPTREARPLGLEYLCAMLSRGKLECMVLPSTKDSLPEFDK